MLRSDWLAVSRRSRTIAVVIFWAAVNSLLAVWSALEGHIPVWLFVGMGFLMNLTVALSRLRRKPEGKYHD